MLAIGTALRAGPICAKCHPKETARFLASPMGTSIARPEPLAPGKVTHGASGAVIATSERNGRMVHSLTERGYIFESPVSWDNGHGWQVSPGYGPAAILDFDRSIGESCPFCHTGRPRSPERRVTVSASSAAWQERRTCFIRNRSKAAAPVRAEAGSGAVPATTVTATGATARGRSPGGLHWLPREGPDPAAEGRIEDSVLAGACGGPARPRPWAGECRGRTGEANPAAGRRIPRRTAKRGCGRAGDARDDLSANGPGRRRGPGRGAWRNSGRRAIGVDPSLRRAYMEPAILYDGQGRRKEMLAIIDRYLHWNPQDVMFRAQRAAVSTP